MHQRHLVLATKIHKLDILDFVVKVHALAGGVDAAVGGAEVALEITRKIRFIVFDTVYRDYPKEKN